MLNYAYRRRLPCQIVIGANKEAILSERHHTARLNQTVAVGFSGAQGCCCAAPRAACPSWRSCVGWTAFGRLPFGSTCRQCILCIWDLKGCRLFDPGAGGWAAWGRKNKLKYNGVRHMWQLPSALLPYLPTEVIYPEQCGTFDDFMGKVQKTWDSHWDTVFDANWAGAQHLPEATFFGARAVFWAGEGAVRADVGWGNVTGEGSKPEAGWACWAFNCPFPVDSLPPKLIGTPTLCCCAATELEEMPAPRIDNEYPLWMALRMLGALLVNWAFFALCTYYTYRFCCAVLALFGPLQPVVASLAVLYIAGSFLTYRHPVLALQVHQQRAPSLVASRMENDLSNGQREESAAQPAVKKES